MSAKDTDASANASTTCRERSASAKSRWRPARIGARSSELGVEEPRRQAPKLIAEGENFAKKAFRRYKKTSFFWKKRAKQPRLRKMRQLNQLPRRAPTRELSERGTCMWVSGSDKQHGGKILGVIAFSRSEGNDQRER